MRVRRTMSRSAQYARVYVVVWMDILLFFLHTYHAQKWRPSPVRADLTNKMRTYLLVCQAVVHGVVHRDRIILANHVDHASVGVNLLKGNVQTATTWPKLYRPHPRYPKQVEVRNMSEHPAPSVGKVNRNISKTLTPTPLAS